MKEQTLIAEMNKFIRKDLEDKRKEQERTEPIAKEEPAKPLTLHTPQEQASEVELLLIREVVRHGEEIIYDDIETEDGQHISLSVAEYIDFDLSQDQLLFTQPVHNQILAEAVAHCKEPGFKAETYFCSHPDQEISRLATHLAIDRHQLGGRFVMQPRENSLQQRVLHLVMDFRLDILETHLKDIQQQLRQATGDMEHTLRLLQEFKSMQELRNTIAKKLGSDLIV
jgi:DNA primase